MATKKNAQKKENTAPKMNPTENKKSKGLIIGFIIFAVAVVGLIGYAFLYDKVLKYNKPVAVVGDNKIKGNTLDQRVRIARYSYVNQYTTYMYYATIMADYEEYASYYQSMMSSLLSYMDDYETFGEDILNSLIDNELYLIEAEKRGITVTDAEVEELMQQIFDYYPEETATTPTATYALEPTSTLTSLQKTLVAVPTATATQIPPTATVAETEEIEPTATTEASPTATEIASTPTSEEPLSTATPLPTATVYTEELYQENYQAFLVNLDESGVEEESFKEYVRDYLIYQKVYEAITAEVPRVQDQVWARHILVETEAEANTALGRLNAGEDWSAVCNEVTLDQSSPDACGDLGWFAQGQTVEEFESAAFNLEIGEISAPVESSYGWHIIQVIGHEERAIELDTDYQQIQSNYFDAWYQDAKANTEIVINDNWVDHVPSEPSVDINMRVE